MTAITEALRHTSTGLSLASVDPASTPGFRGAKSDGVKALTRGAAKLAELQERLFAASKGGDGRSVLVLLQGMDTSGKGGLVRHVVGQVDPQGVQLHSFKAPTPAEKRHDFLWRIERAVPAAGMIGVFDRSQYEDVLIHRVRQLSAPEVVEARYGQIADFEHSLAERGVSLIKVMVHISRDEQGKRLRERLERPDKHWKFNPADIDERSLWDEYQAAYEIAINRTATEESPWYVVPGDRKWFARLAVQELLTETLSTLDPQWPSADFDVKAELRRLDALG